MTSYVALLRAINVGGSNIILMAELRDMMTSLGFKNVSTYLQSGNVIFSSGLNDISKLEEQIKNQIYEVFGYDISLMVINKAIFSRIFAKNPMINNLDLDIKKIAVTFLSGQPEIEKFEGLKNNAKYPEEMILMDGIIYLYYVNGFGRSKLTNKLMESRLGVKATTRNWRTVTNVNYKLENI